MKNRKIRVLVIDDSLFMRTLVSGLLSSDPGIKVVDTAKDGEEALKKVFSLQPDCITLDLVMPGLDGLKTLEQIMTQAPTPVIMLSAHSRKDADITLQCLNAGAVGFVLKPSGELSLDIDIVKHELLEKVKAASTVEITKLTRRAPKKLGKPGIRPIITDRIVMIGSSTGGPQTLERILYSMPSTFPVPMIIAQHMPSLFYTTVLAEHLNKICELEVRVAEDGEAIRAGKVCMAPGGYQTRIVPGERWPRVVLTEEKSVMQGPSIDIAMKSAAEVCRENTIGIILTGMGSDGREGMKAIKEAGGRTMVEDQSALIFGMPKAVMDAGYADQALPAGEIAPALAELVTQVHGSEVQRLEKHEDRAF
jgi:two-component system, chemotaxis family, protein-glutamate methylesterase/glutaminase